MTTILHYRRTNHMKHIVWGVLTGGLWLFTGYPVCVLLNRRARAMSIVRPQPKSCTPVPCPSFGSLQLRVTDVCSCRHLRPGELYTPGCPIHDPAVVRL